MPIIVRANETLIRAGVGLRITTGTPLPSSIRGRFGYVGRAQFGPLNTAVEMLSRSQIAATYGPSGVGGATVNTMDGAEEAFNGGAVSGVVVRVGTGGTAGQDNISDSLAAVVGNVQLKYPGSMVHQYIVRAAPDGSANKELVLLRGGAVLETFRFSTTGVQIANLVTAVGNASGAFPSKSGYIYVNQTAAGNSTVADVAQKNIPAGTEPTIDASAYTAALTTLGKANWFVACFDTEDTTLHTSIRSWTDQLIMKGRLRVSVLGIPSSVAYSARKTAATGHNNPAVVLWGNGFTKLGSDGLTSVTVDGFRAAARMAGAYAACRPNQQLTHRVVQDATGVIGALTDDELTEAKQSGLCLLGWSADNRVRVEEGINTLTNPAIPPQWAEGMSSAWRKQRRVMTRFYLMDDITSAWDHMIETSQNTPAGRDALKSEAQSVMNRYIASGALISGEVQIDNTRQPTAAADEAFFVFDNVVDADGAERIILNAIFP